MLNYTFMFENLALVTDPLSRVEETPDPFVKELTTKVHIFLKPSAQIV